MTTKGTWRDPSYFYTCLDSYLDSDLDTCLDSYLDLYIDSYLTQERMPAKGTQGGPLWVPTLRLTKSFWQES